MDKNNDTSAGKELFRSQAVDYHRTKQYGTVILAHSVSYRVLTLLAVMIAIALILFFIFFSTTRKAQSRGVLLPSSGVIRINSVQTGLLIERRVSEGQSVGAGDVLFVLNSERSSEHAPDAQKAISTLLKNRRDSFGRELEQAHQQSQQRILAMQRRVTHFQDEIHKLDNQIELQQQRVVIAEQAYQRFSELNKSNYISAAQLQDKQAELLDQRQRLGDLQRSKMANERDMTTTRSEVSDLQLQAQRNQAALERDVSTLEQDLTENESRREIFVRASQSGVVTAITAEVGQTVTAEQTLVALLPKGAELEAEIYVPSRSAGFLKEGMPVMLRYQSYPYQKFGQYGAHVKEIAMTALNPGEFVLPGATLASGTDAEPLYRVRLKLDRQNVQAYGQTYPLKSGMLIDASIVLEKRRLYEWILEPLYSISGRI